ncbi:uncharacterized protein G2W53_031565 [Senna tora]|uniref:Uncharacterized protein n=1 Tax=Senna tora TaxID=362788 RepID=A0A834WFN5_9FABA|nr:uncharacterized protein G2W53_031565 [Senna tora]
MGGSRHFGLGLVRGDALRKRSRKEAEEIVMTELRDGSLMSKSPWGECCAPLAV